jgi:hypothetical protein
MLVLLLLAVCAYRCSNISQALEALARTDSSAFSRVCPDICSQNSEVLEKVLFGVLLF